MGRRSTGAYTTGEVKRIELSYLIKQGYLVKGKKTTGILSWTNNDSTISIDTYFYEGEKYIQLSYTSTNPKEGTKKLFNYKIDIVAIPSNLGNGEVLYFVCPVSGNRCRILYKAYNSDIWKSRDAYQNRIYYSLQQCSKLDRYNTKYWILEKRLTKHPMKRVYETYRGIASKTAIKNKRMWQEMERMDKLRWSPLGMPKKLYGYAMEMGY